jgi:hypothetical protein
MSTLVKEIRNLAERISQLNEWRPTKKTPDNLRVQDTNLPGPDEEGRPAFALEPSDAPPEHEQILNKLKIRPGTKLYLMLGPSTKPAQYTVKNIDDVQGLVLQIPGRPGEVSFGPKLISKWYLDGTLKRALIPPKPVAEDIINDTIITDEQYQTIAEELTRLESELE